MFPHLCTMISEPIEEAKNPASDVAGISDLVTDCLDDLVDKIGHNGSLTQLFKEVGADKLDTAKDKDGFTVLQKLAKLTTDYAREIKKLMTEAELMISSSNLNEGLRGPISESKDYDDSGDFTDELHRVDSNIAELKNITSQPRWTNWMQVTDDNYNTSCVALNDAFVKKLRELDKALGDLEDDLNSAS